MHLPDRKVPVLAFFYPRTNAVVLFKRYANQANNQFITAFVFHTILETLEFLLTGNVNGGDIKKGEVIEIDSKTKKNLMSKRNLKLFKIKILIHSV